MSQDGRKRLSDLGGKPPWPFIVVGLVALLIIVNVARGSPGPRTDAPRPPTPVHQPTAQADTHDLDHWIEWSAEDGPQNYRVAGYQIAASTGFRDGQSVARLTLTDADGLTTTLLGNESSFGPSIAFAVVQLDASNPLHQIIVSSYSGGAHCCTSITVLEPRNGHWLSHDLGSWDGDRPALPRDLDEDGIKEFQFVDQAFLYAFASYADSWSPPLFKRLIDGRLTDVSLATAFRPHFQRYAATSREACLVGSNGACAAYVAAAARTGNLDTAWTTMIGAYDQASDWSLPTACRLRTSGDCQTDARLEFATFPEALQWFLGEQGYMPASYVPPLQAAGPSFDCGAARTDTETVICADSHLATLDRTMAFAYTRASALSPDRSALRTSQRSFLAARNMLSSGDQIAAHYEQRISVLLAVD